MSDYTTLFIIAQHRTGSTLLKNMLDAHSNITMAFDEMNLFEPFRKNTLDRLIGRKITSASELIDFIERRKIYGTFWKDFERSGIDKYKLELELANKPFTLELVVETILNELSLKWNKKISGVKYPVHFSGYSFIKRFFPGSKVIFLTRNPKSIVASKLNDSAAIMRKKGTFLRRLIYHYFVLIYFSVEYKRSIDFWSKNIDKLHLVKYEQLVLTPEATLSKVCEFCEINYMSEMLVAEGKASSYSTNEGKGPRTSSVNMYKASLSRFDRFLISLITSKSEKKLSV